MGRRRAREGRRAIAVGGNSLYYGAPILTSGRLAVDRAKARVIV